MLMDLTVIRIALIQEVKDHRSDYMWVFGSKEHFNYILNVVYPPENSNGIAYEISG